MRQTKVVKSDDRLRISLAKKDNSWNVTAQYPPPRNPYEQAAGMQVADLPEFVARQYGAYPNPHFLAALAISEAISGYDLAETACGSQRRFTEQAIIVRDLAMHLGTCLQSGDFQHPKDEQHIKTVLETVRLARDLERCLAGTISSPRLFIGGTRQPDRSELRQIAGKLAERVSDMQYLLALVSGCGSCFEHLPVLMVSVSRLLAAIRFVSLAGQPIYRPATWIARRNVGPRTATVVVNAPRGMLLHLLAMDSDSLKIASGAVTVPTDGLMRQFMVHAGAAVSRWVNQGVERQQIDGHLVRLARAYNPCGLDLRADFADVVWEE